MAERPEFQQKQFAFAAHIRDPEHMPAPAGIEDRRMAIYRELFFNNLLNLISNYFPVLKKLHTREQWRRLVRLFMRQHRSQTPYFLRLPDEFLRFLQEEYAATKDDFPFLVELAHYEYIEIALSISTESNDMAGIDPGGDLLDQTPVKSRLAWVHAYQFPVHRITSNFLPSEPDAEPLYLCVYRRADDEVRFMELNPVAARLLGAVEDNTDGSSGEMLLRRLATEIEYADAGAFVQHGLAALDEMRQLDILIGTKPSAKGGKSWAS